MRTLPVLLLSVLLGSNVSLAATKSAPKPAKPNAGEDVRCPAGPSEMVIEHGEYSMLTGANMSLRGVRAVMTPRGKSLPSCLTKDTHIDSGQVTIAAPSLSKLFASKLDRGKNSKISDLKVETSQDKVKISGKMKKLIPMPFSIEGPVSSDGRNLQLKAEKISVMGIPSKAILEAVGMELGSILGSSSPKGITAKDDTLIFDPAQIFHMRGKISHAAIEAGNLVVDFGAGGQKGKEQIASGSR